MLASTIKPLVLLLTLVTGIGVLVHDTHVDKASTIALTAPVVVAGYGLAHSVEFKTNDPHTHVERASESLRRIVTAQPRLHTRFTDEKKYISPKKLPFQTSKDEELFSFA